MGKTTGLKGALTISQQKLEQWINDQLTNGNSQALKGLVDPTVLDRGKSQLEDFRIRVETDADLIERIGQKDFDAMQAFRDAEHVKKIGEKPEAHTENEEEMEAFFAALAGGDVDSDE